MSVLESDKSAVFQSETEKELEAILKENTECREIVKQIMDLNVSERQILKLIELLAYELTNVEHMKTLSQTTNDILNNLNQSDKIL